MPDHLTLIDDEHDRLVREVNRKGETVWEFSQAELPSGIVLHNIQTADRLANGNTVMFSSTGGTTAQDRPGIIQVLEVTPDKKVVWVLQDWRSAHGTAAMQMERIIQEYLASPEDRRSTTIEEMARRPDEAFSALMNFRGPYPANQHPVDVFPDSLSPLLTDLLLRCPRLLTGRDLSRMSSGERWVVLCAAIESESREFADVILAGLRDRSSDVKLLAVRAVTRCAFLRRPDARPQLKKLLALKSMSWCRGDVQRALDLLDEGANTGG